MLRHRLPSRGCSGTGLRSLIALRSLFWLRSLFGLRLLFGLRSLFGLRLLFGLRSLFGLRLLFGLRSLCWPRLGQPCDGRAGESDRPFHHPGHAEHSGPGVDRHPAACRGDRADLVQCVLGGPADLLGPGQAAQCGGECAPPLGKIRPTRSGLAHRGLPPHAFEFDARVRGRMVAPARTA
ncbi:hypothetical protein [Streptomyces collinus]|uniref:hypothetical protein n=1 Tax=Streptomyces collinus TaxID=42684 RepID=UPI003699B592